MTQAWIVSTARTPIGTAYKGALRDVRAEVLARTVVEAVIERAGLPRETVEDIVLAESLYGGGDLARHAAVAAGLTGVPGQAINRHCAGGLTAVSNAAALVGSGMVETVIAGGVQSTSTGPELTWSRPDGTQWRGMAPTFPHTDDADDDVTLTVGFNVAEHYGLTREQMDRWALRSHQRAVAAIDDGRFAEETVDVPLPDGGVFAVDEHPRRNTSLEKLAALAPLHPEIPGFSITAGNASGVNDCAAAVMVVSERVIERENLTPLAGIAGWASVGVEPRLTGVGSVRAIERLLDRVGLQVGDIDLWEINEAFASVPLAACVALGIDEDCVNVLGSGCSLGHPVAASGTRMIISLIHELRRRGGGRGVAAMCAGGAQGGAVMIEVPAAASDDSRKAVMGGFETAGIYQESRLGTPAPDPAGT
jgi:acetyl-CoA acetyltransferase family protein